MNSASVLLLENDQAVIKDVTCSLRLIGLPVMTCISVAEAHETIKKYRPTLIIARFKEGLDNLGLQVSSLVKQDPTTKDIPLYALCSAGDQADLNNHQDIFNGQFILPVEFPAFPRTVQEILGVPEGPRPAANQVAGFVATKKIAPEISISNKQPVNQEIKDRNFALAYAIQSRVLRELEQDARMEAAPLEQVPGILNQVTAKVCIKYATEKILY